MCYKQVISLNEIMYVKYHEEFMIHAVEVVSKTQNSTSLHCPSFN